MMVSLKNLMEPGRIGSMKLKNRAVMAPMGVDYASPDGLVSQRQIDYYAERAAGGVGLVIVEASCVQPSLGKSFQQIHVDEDRFIPKLRELAEAIRTGGAKPAIQLHHAGAAAYRALTRQTPAGPSSVLRRGFEQTRALSKEEIREIADLFGRAAARCRSAGFEGFEIHAAHQYIFSQFLSPLWNERRDEYGGSVENRARFLVEVVGKIKESVPELPVICRINSEEYGTKEFAGLEKGITLEETLTVAGILEKAGADAIHISRTGWGRYLQVTMPYVSGEMLPHVEAVKKAVSIPLIAVGSFSLEDAERALEEGKADFIAFGRGLIADPFLIRNAMDGRQEDTRPCIACFNCQSEYVSMKPEEIGVRCSVNARAGRETHYPLSIPKTTAPKKVVVVGGGPGGMEAARFCALRGHRVVLFEKERSLGGQILIAGVPPHKQRLADFVDYEVRQLSRLGVELRLGMEANEGLVRSERPDAVFVAVGMDPILPNIPGLHQAKVHFASEILSGREKAGDRVVIIGGSLVGCETADFLTEQDPLRKVSVIEILPKIGAKIPAMVRPVLLSHLRTKGVRMFAGMTCEEITEKEVVAVEAGGAVQRIAMDTLIIAAGGRAKRRLYDSLLEYVPVVHLIGDAAAPRRIVDAVYEAFRAAYAL